MPHQFPADPDLERKLLSSSSRGPAALSPLLRRKNLRVSSGKRPSGPCALCTRQWPTRSGSVLQKQTSSTLRRSCPSSTTPTTYCAATCPPVPLGNYFRKYSPEWPPITQPVQTSKWSYHHGTLRPSQRTRETSAPRGTQPPTATITSSSFHWPRIRLC